MSEGWGDGGGELTAYYNEIDPYAAAWLRNLISANLIAPGEVDERSIVDVRPADVRGFRQCHFFAGIGGWSYALRLAGWPDDREVWTGSCPCQPWSVSGKRKGASDERHLWPEWRRLVEELRPPILFGEQVTGTPAWLGLVRSDLEAMEYAVGALPMEAACADAEHFRERYWFVADRDGFGSQEQIGQPVDTDAKFETASGSDLRAVVDASSERWGEGWTEHEFRSRGFTAAVSSVLGRCYVECPDGKWRRLPPPGVRWLGTRIPARIPKLRALGNAIDPRPAAAFITAVMGSVILSAGAMEASK